MDSTPQEQLEKVKTEMRRLLEKGNNSETLNKKYRRLNAEVNGWKVLYF